MNIVKNKLKWGMIATLVAALGALQGCATSVSKLSSDGNSDAIIFPDIKKDAWVKEGIFPNIENLRNVAPDMTKDQIYALLGHPHFSEGIGSVREWDYILNFRKNGGTDVETCQYKIIYTPGMRLRSTYWKPASCVAWLNPPVVQAQTVVEKIVEKDVPGPEVIKMQIGTDGMFAFDKSAIADLRPGGIEKLNQVSNELLAGGDIVQLKIVGHTDRLGNDDYNQKLSQARANTIRQFLIAKNIPAEHIIASGVGKSMPLVECPQSKRDEALIRCLEPNRRFEIEAWTTRKM